jgi:uncharacterized membrane protein YhaH (DUF805 family)
MPLLALIFPATFLYATNFHSLRKAILASLFFIFVPLYALGYFTRLHLFVGSVITTARNLFNFSGKEGRDSYLLWSVTVALLVVLIEAFSIFSVVLPKLTAARTKLGFRQTNWAQFFNGTSRGSHALVWLLMTSATIRRVRSTGFPVWAVVPFFLMAFSVDVNDVLEFAGLYTNVDNHSSAVKYLLSATSYLATIGYSVVFTAGIVILLFVLPEADEVLPIFPSSSPPSSSPLPRPSPTRRPRSTSSKRT